MKPVQDAVYGKDTRYNQRHYACPTRRLPEPVYDWCNQLIMIADCNNYYVRVMGADTGALDPELRPFVNTRIGPTPVMIELAFIRQKQDLELQVIRGVEFGAYQWPLPDKVLFGNEADSPLVVHTNSAIYTHIFFDPNKPPVAVDVIAEVQRSPYLRVNAAGRQTFKD